jgi:hypothetical protein
MPPVQSISTRHPERLPGVAELERLCQSLAILDAILEPEWDLHYYSFNAHWAEGEAMGSMRNGSGDDYFILFNRCGAIIIGCAHESPMAESYVTSGRPWPRVIDDVPAEFASAIAEPAFSPLETTFCLWRKRTDMSWHRGDIDFPPGDDPDGSADLLAMLDGDPRTYRAWCSEYYEARVPLKAITAVYRHAPLTDELILQINADADREALLEDVSEIGYPSSLNGTDGSVV